MPYNAWSLTLCALTRGALRVYLWRHACGADRVTHNPSPPAACDGCGDDTPPPPWAPEQAAAADLAAA